MAAQTSSHNTEKPKVRTSKATAKSRNTRESIVAVAIELFRTKGYGRTSLSEISRQAGIDPSSFYYYFSSKDALVNSVFDKSKNIPEVQHLEQLSGNRAAQLCSLIIFDTVRKCELPVDYIELETIATQNRDAFDSFFEHYRMLYKSIVTILQRGIAEGVFIPCTPDVRAVTILSLDEGLQHHFHAKHRDELILAASGYPVRNYTPEDIARMAAYSVIPSIVKNQSEVEPSIDEGLKLYYQLNRETDNQD